MLRRQSSSRPAPFSLLVVAVLFVLDLTLGLYPGVERVLHNGEYLRKDEKCVIFPVPEKEASLLVLSHFLFYSRRFCALPGFTPF